MSFTFDETLPTERDFVRFKLDDVESDDPRLSNELIDTLLTKYGLSTALLDGCNRIKLFWGKEPDTIGLTGRRLFQWRERYRAYSDLYKQLLAEVNGGLYDADYEFVRVGVLDFSDDDKCRFLPVQPFYNSLIPQTERDARLLA